MIPKCFYIIDDFPKHYGWMSDLIRGAFPDCSICSSGPARSWDAVFLDFRANALGREALVVLCDVAIPSDLDEIEKGVLSCSKLKLIRCDAVLIANTQYAADVRRHRKCEEVFSGVIDKTEQFQRWGAEGVEGFRRRILRACGEDHGLDAGLLGGVRYVDSLGLRLLTAAFSEELLQMLVGNVAADWSDVEVSAPSQGFSGCAVLRLRGSRGGLSSQLIVKLARRKDALEREVERRRVFLDRLGRLGRSLVPVDSEVSVLGDGDAFYYRQLDVPGNTLLEGLMLDVDNCLCWKALEELGKAEEQQCCAAVSTGSVERPEGVLSIASVDCERFRASKDFVCGIAGEMKNRSLLGIDLPSADDLFAAVLTAGQQWSQRLSERDSVYMAVQHGDLHPRNVMVAEDGGFALIDEGRLGLWPLGYDLVRLGIMLRVRILDGKSYRDWLFPEFEEWRRHGFCQWKWQDGDHKQFPWSICDSKLAALLCDRSDIERSRIEYGFIIGSAWDLFKIVSYQDLSPAKRLWALVGTWEIMKLGGLID